ncbi:MAG: AAA family ATPase [Myxococcales bacterium]|nr:AAA family ATPase [Myxococcales bacterium]
MARAPTHLRPDPTAFIGRSTDLARLRSALEASRLVSLTGPPGVGKTRLAKELGLGHGGSVAFVDLAAVGGVDGVATKLASAIDVPLSVGRSAADAVQQLGRALSGRGALTLIFDNFDHLVAHAAATVGAWLEAAPAVRCLVTSRQRLGLEGELCVELRPLALGADSDAVQLFVERARAVRPGFELGASDSPVVRRIVERLDGLPLCIELAAARVGVLGVRQLLERLERSLAALERGEGESRSTLRGALEWSWELSSDADRQVLRAVSACAGGFDAKAAEALTEQGEVLLLDALDSLRTRSLLSCQDLAGEVRFHLLETVREFARDKLAQSGELARVERRHAEHYLALGRRWAEGVDGPHALDCLAHLSLERENLVAVARRGLAVDPPTREGVESALAALLALERPCIMREPLDEYAALLARGLERALELGVDRKLIVEALRMHGGLSLFLGRPGDTERDNHAALRLARELGDDALEARIMAALALSGLRRVPVAPDELPKRRIDARLGMEEALARYPHRDARRGIILNNLGVILESLEDWEEAERRYDEAVACYQGVACQSAGVALASRGALHYASGRSPEGQADLRRALDFLRAFDDRRTIAYAHAELGALLVEQGLAEAARAELEACLACHADNGFSWYEGNALASLGDLELALGDATAARDRYLAALVVARSAGDRALQVRALAGESSALARQGSLEPARRAAGAAALLADDPVSKSLTEIAEGFVALAEAAAASSATRARDARDLARRKLQAVERVPEEHRSFVARAARQRLAEALRADAEGRASSSGSDALRVTADGKWFRPPGSAGVSLHRRLALALVLERLLGLRIDSPGEGASLADLFRAGWPGDRADAHSAAMRVHQAVATLRKLGLREALLRKEDGYLLDPNLAVARVDKPDA